MMNYYYEQKLNYHEKLKVSDILNYYEAGAYIGLFTINLTLFVLQIHAVVLIK